MDHRAALILAASLLCGSVHAGYAQLAPPEGWSAGGGAAATYRYPSAANAATFSNGTVLTNASLNVGGRAVQVPATMRMAANAGRVAAAAIYLHPGLRTIAAVAAWVGAAGFVYDAVKGWTAPDTRFPVSEGIEYQNADGSWGADIDKSCESVMAKNASLNPNIAKYEFFEHRTNPQGMRYCMWKVTTKPPENIYYTNTIPQTRPSPTCPAGWYVTPAGCVQTPPSRSVGQPEFEQMVPDARPMPPELPGVVWPASWPVEVPEIRPVFIPTGNPVPNPKYDPSAPPSTENQPFVQPGVNVRPAPSPSSPWQVDLQPVNRPTSNPKPGSDPVPDTNPDGSPKPDSGDTPREGKGEDKQDLCERHPDILACQKLDEPEDPGKLKVQEVDFDFQPETGFAGSASCPAPITVSLSGQVFSISWQPFCNSLNMIRPFLLAMAWLSAAFIMLGARKE